MGPNKVTMRCRALDAAETAWGRTMHQLRILSGPRSRSPKAAWTREDELGVDGGLSGHLPPSLGRMTNDSAPRDYMQARRYVIDDGTSAVRQRDDSRTGGRGGGERVQRRRRSPSGHRE